MKKLLALLLLALMLIPIAVSCASDDATTTVTTAPITTTAPVSTTAPITTTSPVTTTAPITTTPIKYSITYELNGGINAKNNPTEYNAGDVINLSFPEKEDFMFMGWYTDSLFSNEITEIRDNSRDITLYAKWISYDEVLEITKFDEQSRVVTGLKDGIDIKTIIIPSTYKGLPVTSIETGAFSFNDSIIKIVINDGITTIKTTAFYECTSLKSIILPSTLATIEKNALGGCTSLESIYIDEDSQNFKTVDGVLYSKDGSELVRYPSAKEGTAFTVPNQVTTIKVGAFAGNTNLTDITLHNGITHIEEYAFSYFTTLESIVIPDSVIELGRGAFNKCTSLKSVSLPKNIEIIDINTFLGCTSLNNIVIPSGVKSIDRSAFYECSSLESVIIPKSVETIKEFAFDRCNEKLIIYAEAESLPDGWSNQLGPILNAVWGYKDN